MEKMAARERSVEPSILPTFVGVEERLEATWAKVGSRRLQ